jgi:hypothetical protein
MKDKVANRFNLSLIINLEKLTIRVLVLVVARKFYSKFVQCQKIQYMEFPLNLTLPVNLLYLQSQFTLEVIGRRPDGDKPIYFIALSPISLREFLSRVRQFVKAQNIKQNLTSHFTEYKVFSDKNCNTLGISLRRQMLN